MLIPQLQRRKVGGFNLRVLHKSMREVIHFFISPLVCFTGDQGEEDVDICDDMPSTNFPPVEIDKDDKDANASESSSSSSSSSDSSSSSGIMLGIIASNGFLCYFPICRPEFFRCFVTFNRFRFREFVGQRF